MYRGGRGRGSSRSPPRDMSYRRGGGSSRGSWRGGAGGGRGDFRSYGSRMSDSYYPGEERFRSSVDRDPPRDYGRLDCLVWYFVELDWFWAAITILLDPYSYCGLCGLCTIVTTVFILCELLIVIITAWVELEVVLQGV